MSLPIGPLAFLPSMGEWIVLLVIGLLLFGKDLPRVLKDAGRKVAELKRTFEKLKAQLHEDKDFRELSNAAADLKDAVTAPRRMLEDTVRGATSGFLNDVETVRRDLTTSVAKAGEQGSDPAVAFTDLTYEDRATPGPDATFTPASSAPSPLIFEAEKWSGA